MFVSSIKERLFGAITVMDETNAKQLWDFVLELYRDDWNSIEESDPDPIDLQMIAEAEKDPNCQVMATEDEVKRVLG